MGADSVCVCVVAHRGVSTGDDTGDTTTDDSGVTCAVLGAMCISFAAVFVAANVGLRPCVLGSATHDPLEETGPLPPLKSNERVLTTPTAWDVEREIRTCMATSRMMPSLCMHIRAPRVAHG